MRITLLAVTILGVTLGADVPAKPRTRATAEGRQANLDRYKLGGFGPNATSSLGVEVKFQTTDPQGVAVLQFKEDSAAKAAGMKQYDVILEVDGSAVGFIRGRFYELWPHYGRAGEQTTEVLVTYQTANGRRYYYLPVKTSTVSGDVYYKSLPPDFFTVEKPITRDTAETREQNIARYQFGSGNFEKYSAWELGTKVSYSYDSGATIQAIKPGSPAANAGLKVGDMILEVDGAPIGQWA